MNYPRSPSPTARREEEEEEEDAAAVESIHSEYEPTQDEIYEYAKYLGFELPEDEDLLWIAAEGLKETLPPEWKSFVTQAKSDAGEGGGEEDAAATTVYYFNHQTGESSWLHPCDVKYIEVFKQEKEKKQAKRAGTPPPPPPPPPPAVEPALDAMPSPPAFIPAATSQPTTITTTVAKEEEVAFPTVKRAWSPPRLFTSASTLATNAAFSPPLASYQAAAAEVEDVALLKDKLRRAQAENKILLEENKESREYAMSASEQVQMMHSKWLQAEARARGVEDELARVKNELKAAQVEFERRRFALTQELDETVRALITAENARDLAERKTRELLVHESTRAKHMEREIEQMSKLMAKAGGQLSAPTGESGSVRPQTKNGKTPSPTKPPLPPASASTAAAMTTTTTSAAAAATMSNLRNRHYPRHHHSTTTSALDSSNMSTTKF